MSPPHRQPTRQHRGFETWKSLRFENNNNNNSNNKRKKKRSGCGGRDPRYRLKYLYRSHTELHGEGFGGGGSRGWRPAPPAGPDLLLREGGGGCRGPGPAPGRGWRREVRGRSQLPARSGPGGGGRARGLGAGRRLSRPRRSPRLPRPPSSPGCWPAGP